MANSVIPVQHAEQFILSGRAELVVHNTKTDGHRKYRIVGKKEELFYVYCNKEYIGCISFRRFIIPARLDYSLFKNAKGFELVWQWVTNLHLPKHVQLMHTGVCGHCGRPLTDPESIELGLGPVCRGKVNAKRIRT